MSVNSSSSSKDSLLHPNLSPISYDLPLYMYCFTTAPSSFILNSFTMTSISLILPLCIFVIYHGLQQWRQKHSSSSAATMSHSDSFTYHMVTMELIGVFGSVLCCCGVYSDHLKILIVGCSLFTFNWFGEMFFHTLTCLERYLAVVHPITYLSLRTERGTRIRNITIGCVWLLCVVGTSSLVISDVYSRTTFSLLMLSLAIVFFCTLSVLRVLLRPGPGEHAGGRERVDQSKLRAFYTIMVILGVLVMRFSSNLVVAVLHLFERGTECMTMAYVIWFNLPSSLVLPLLFLHRAGKLMRCLFLSRHQMQPS